MKTGFFFLLGLLCAGPVWAQDVLIIGEVHDNPAHHVVQADRVQAFAPKALIFEMLTPEQVLRSPIIEGDQDALGVALNWKDSGWPAFDHYYPIMQAAEGARLYGAGLRREQARAALKDGLEIAFGDEAGDYGLTQALPAAQQMAREDLQAEAHCGALPQSALPKIVMVQRLRDAMLARAVVQAMTDTGGPVAVITGNGHARRDWGMPSVLTHVAPELKIYVIGQGEGDATPDGAFDEVLTSPVVAREDPCLAFQ